MKLRKLLVMLSVALALTMLTVLVCDMRNPMMGFMLKNPARIYVAALSLCAIAEGCVIGYEPKRKKKTKAHTHTEEEP